jgi:hypothetical protein
MIRNAEKCVFGNSKKIAKDPLNTITDGAVSLKPGQMFVYYMSPARGLQGKCPINEAAKMVATRLGLALVQWPNANANVEGRTWCWAIQKPTA